MATLKDLGRALVPNWTNTFEEFRRYHHLDVDELTGWQIWVEIRRLETAIAWEEKPHPWLLERLRTLYDARRARWRRRRT